MMRALVLLSLHLLTDIWGWPSFNDYIPNGDKVPNPCNPSLIWYGVGHLGAHGSGPRNQFGKDFLKANKKWEDICRLDSDGDGQYNGLELGDPNCEWSTTNRNLTLPAFSHPGICEPWDSPRCLAMNGSLDCDADKVSTKCEQIDEPGVKKYDMFLNNYSIPLKEWSFVCRIFNLPTNKDYHVIASKPINHQHKLLKKVAVYGCNPNMERITRLGVFECSSIIAKPCQDLIAIMTTDQMDQGNCFPRDVGLQIGKTGYKQILMKWTFVNPRKEQSVTQAGMSLFITPNLKKYNAGVAILEETHFSVPGNLPSYSVSSACPSSCTQLQMRSPVTIVAGVNVMRHYGVKQRVDVERNDRIYNSITNDTSYDVFDPTVFWYTTPVPVLPGDMLKLTCEYNTMNVRSDVNWGMGPNQELCKTILIFYPKENWDDHHCESFKNIPLCALEIGDSVFGCTYGGFMTALNSNPLYDLTKCSILSTCTDECLQRVTAVRGTPCLSGDMYELWKLMARSLRNNKLITLFKALVTCEERYTTTLLGTRSQSHGRG
ncbi:MOXD1 homolog 1-like [Saccostrea cucullata]|uniref:MOXD1 homolog 1-like n=1 Tax=Saccostrea cuccullata TaxID=36930 RepID=UPI002ED507CB